MSACLELATGKVLPHMEMSVWGRVGSALNAIHPAGCDGLHKMSNTVLHILHTESAMI